MKTFIAFVSILSLVLSDLEIAPYEVTKQYEEWDVRKFPPTKWISTDAQDVAPHDGPEHSKVTFYSIFITSYIKLHPIQAFFRLFNYIDGSNNMNMKIPMTAPVSMRIIPGEGPNCESNFTMSFYIPSSLQEDTPTPTDPLVYIEERPEFEVVSKQFGGFPNDLKFSAEAAELYVLAEEEGLSVKDVPLWTAGYDGPSVIINRRNEVWLEI